MMRSEHDVIVELFADDPHWQHRVFEMFTYLDVLEGFKDCQKTKLGPLGDTFDLVVIDDLLPVKTV